MNRFQKLAALTLATALGLVTIGVIVRATDSGLGCPDWPLCHGQLIPSLGDTKAWIEWVHRTVAVIIGFEILALAILAVRDYRDRRSILWPALAAVGLVGFQAWLGRETVRLGNSGESVTAHLAAALTLVALLVYLTVRAGYPARIGGRGASQRFTLFAAFTTGATFALLLFGSHVTATASALVFPDWPLMNGSLLPAVTDVTAAHVLHRWVAAVVGRHRHRLAVVAWRTQRDHPTLVRLAVGLGGPVRDPGRDRWRPGPDAARRVDPDAPPRARRRHLGDARRLDRHELLHGPGERAGDGLGSGEIAGAGPDGTGGPRTTGDTIRAYIALTKPRIIELLLVTTVPAMVLATRDLPGATAGVDWPDWVGLVFWTMIGGTLAAGSANAINCYLDRDIDLLMTRTRRRPLPAHQVDPERAVVFGLALGVLSFLVMVYFVNLTAAFLTLLAIGFYVVVYTILLKRSTPQNIVIGGAAGALPPVIGWAAVTGNVGIPAVLLFLLVFYWTPPHFWALSLRIRKDYAAAGVPMLPVVKGIPETTRQIALYTVLMVAISLVLWAVGADGCDLPRRRGRARRDLPVAGVRPVAPRLVRGGLDRRRDPPLQVLDQLPEPALPRGRGRRPGADPGLRRSASSPRSASSGPAVSGPPRKALEQVRRWPGRSRHEQGVRHEPIPARVALEPRAADLRDACPDGGRHDRRQRVVGEIAGPVDQLAADGPPRPLGMRLDPEAVGGHLGPDVVRAPLRVAVELDLEERPADVEHDRAIATRAAPRVVPRPRPASDAATPVQ